MILMFGFMHVSNEPPYSMCYAHDYEKFGKFSTSICGGGYEP